jgi:hypothetical protein
MTVIKRRRQTNWQRRVSCSCSNTRQNQSTTNDNKWEIVWTWLFTARRCRYLSWSVPLFQCKETEMAPLVNCSSRKQKTTTKCLFVSFISYVLLPNLIHWFTRSIRNIHWWNVPVRLLLTIIFGFYRDSCNYLNRCHSMLRFELVIRYRWHTSIRSSLRFRFIVNKRIDCLMFTHNNNRWNKSINGSKCDSTYEILTICFV